MHIAGRLPERATLRMGQPSGRDRIRKWFSIGLGLAEGLAPGKLVNLLGSRETAGKCALSVFTDWRLNSAQAWGSCSKHSRRAGSGHA